MQHSTKIMKTAVLCSQVYPVWAGDILNSQNQKTLFHASFTGETQLRYATANNGNGTCLDVYASATPNESVVSRPHV